MATLKIGTYGEELGLRIRQGATFGPHRLVISNPVTGLPVDLTGATFRAQVRKKSGDSVPVLSFQCAIFNAATGEMDFWAEDDATITVRAGEDVRSGESQYKWAMDMIDASSRVLPLLYGPVEVMPAVAKP